MMNAEILCIGTELLLGNIVNTNAAYLSQQLAQLGINVYYQSVVGDNGDRLKDALAVAFKRSDLVITTGGLGPTYDDLTKETVAQFFNRPMVVHEPSLQQIQTFFACNPSKMTANNEKQALMPEGSQVFTNHCGTAPGVAVMNENKMAILLPGPPSENQMMFEREVLPFLKQFTDHTFVSRTVHLFGIGESTTESLLNDMMTQSTNPTIAPYAKNGEVLLRVTASASNETEALALITPAIEQIKEVVGEYIYGIDVDTLENAVVQLYKDQNLTVATAESCTGGLISKRLTDIPGSSQVLLGGVCAYTNMMKEKAIAVSTDILNTFGAVSEQTALAMAHGIRQITSADFAVSTTGVAGPDGGTQETPVGLVYIAVVGNHYQHVEKRHITMGPATTRDMIRDYATKVALYELLQAAKKVH